MALVCQPGGAPAYYRWSQAPLPEPDVVDVELLDVDVAMVAGPTAGALELVVPGELVEVVGGLPLPVVGVVVLDWSSAVAGSVVVVVVVDDLPLVDDVPSDAPSGVPLPPVVVDDVPELSVPPVVVLEGGCAAGSVMWPAGTCWR
jgi:hypothetical protein